MVHKITLEREEPTVVCPNSLYGAYRLVITASLAEGALLDDHIFVFTQALPSLYSTIVMDTFQMVCGPTDMQRIPIGVADNTLDSYPNYRTNTVSILCESTVQANNIWNDIQTHTQQLVNACDNLLTLAVTETVTIEAI